MAIALYLISSMITIILTLLYFKKSMPQQMALALLLLAYITNHPR